MERVKCSPLSIRRVRGARQIEPPCGVQNDHVAAHAICHHATRKRKPICDSTARIQQHRSDKHHPKRRMSCSATSKRAVETNARHLLAYDQRALISLLLLLLPSDLQRLRVPREPSERAPVPKSRTRYACAASLAHVSEHADLPALVNFNRIDTPSKLLHTESPALPGAVYSL